jgi:hypothetical protein
VDPSARGPVTQACFPGTDLDALLEDDILVLDGRALEADVHVGGDKRPLRLRLVGVHTPQGDGCFRTNLPPRIGPRQVAALSRGRWEVERRIRLDQSVHRLEAIDAVGHPSWIGYAVGNASPWRAKGPTAGTQVTVL